MKRLLLFFVLIFLSLNVGSVKLLPERLEAINEVDIIFVDSSLTQLNQGVYEFTATIENTGDPAITGTVPISWEKYSYELTLTAGVGTLDESVADYDINGDNDKDDTFNVEWNNTLRPWDAEIDGVYVYALADHPVNRGFNRTYYIDGESKLFQLGNKKHSLYYAEDGAAFFGFDAMILKHPSPNLELVIYSNVSLVDFKIDGEDVEINYTQTGVEFWAGIERPYTAYVVPNQATEFGTDEQMEFSCTIVARETTTCEVALLTNWSPDGNIRYRWVPFDQVDVSFEAINRPYFIGTYLDILDVDTGVKEFKATVKNIGTQATAGDVPISWEKIIYDLPLDDGTGTLVENDVGQDLNGDGDTLDFFDVTWFHNDTRNWDAVVNDGVQDIHAYSFWEGPPEDRRELRTYYINEDPKLFKLGSETHSLLSADNDFAVFGLCDADILHHPNTNFELVFEHEGSFSSLRAIDFEINDEPVRINHTWDQLWYPYWEEIPWNDKVYIVPNSDLIIDQDEEVTFSCTFIAHEAVTSDFYLLLNWSPDGNTRYHWIPIIEEVTFTLPDFSHVSSSLASTEPGVYQFTTTVRNDGAPATAGTMTMDWGKLAYQMPLVDGVGILDESIVDLDLNGDGDKTDTFDVMWSPNATRPWDAVVDGVHAYAIFEGPPDDTRRLETYNLENGKPKLFKLGTETHTLQRAENNFALFMLKSAKIVSQPSPNFKLYFNTTNLSASNFKINGDPVEVESTWVGGEFYPTEPWAGKKRWDTTVYTIPNKHFEIDSGETVSFSCTITAQETITCDLALLMGWSPDGNVRLRWVPFFEADVSFEAPTTTTVPTTASTSTTTIETEPTESIGTPGFSFILSLLIVLPMLVYKHRKKKT
ncbi:MAG: hypothetical protein JSW11_20190 [Candidatus Heimdallarchaeota archaeon]|nr:MAG: hypothetical protein JSW11_20190 [Candidatus Heimdallarchaeota archaeon]